LPVAVGVVVPVVKQMAVVVLAATVQAL